MTHYATLGVSETASVDEIKKAFRKLASQHHPDKGGDTAKFQEIQAAYDILSDQNKRQQYDMERQGGGPGGVQFQWHGGGFPGGMEDIFRQFGFPGGDPFGGFRQQQRRNKDLRINVSLPLITTLENQVKTISVQTTAGTRETVEVNIPRGVTNGMNIKYPGLGDNLFNTIPRGDLFVELNVECPNNFVINGIDLYTKISVNCLKAIVGGTTTITGIDNKVFELTIPAGVQPSTKFRLSQQGLYQLNTDQRGDLYAEIVLTVPQNLSIEQRNTIQAIINNN